MHEKIQQYLRELEAEKGIEILLACETGSRAWGFPSPDSDYDVRILYKHPKDWYLQLTEQADTIERMYEDNEIDITGWDLRKSLRLLMKSNASLFERMQSPVIYHAQEGFLEEFQQLANQCYSKIATMHHYLGLAKRAFAEIESESEYKLKKFFYALRASVACKWILERSEVPPIEFPLMLEGLDIDLALKNRIYELIDLKANRNESYYHSAEYELLNFIKTTITQAEEEASTLPAAKVNPDLLNTFFLQILNRT